MCRLDIEIKRLRRPDDPLAQFFKGSPNDKVCTSILSVGVCPCRFVKLPDEEGKRKCTEHRQLLCLLLAQLEVLGRVLTLKGRDFLRFLTRIKVHFF